MAASSRRTLTSSFILISRRFHPSFSHLLPNSRSRDQSNSPSTTQRTLPRSPTLSRSINPGFSLPLGLRCYSSSSPSSSPSSSTDEFIEEVADVLPMDLSIEISSSSSDAASVPSPFAGEVAAAAADSFPPVAALQHLIDAVHSFTGFNWWASIALTTLLIRGATVPLLLNQMRSTIKLSAMRPEMEKLKEQMQNSMDPQTMMENQKKMKALFTKHGVTPFTPLKGLFIQGPIFISFFLAISNMVEKVPSFKGGGTYWFTDLTTPDPFYALPILTGLTFLVTVELNMQDGLEGNPIAGTMKKFSRGLAVLSVPFTSSFPKAIFCYWITSNLFSLIYGSALKLQPVRKFLNLPDIVPQSSPPPQPDFFFGAPKSIPPNDAEPTKAPERRISSSAVMSQRIRNLEKQVKSRNKPKKR